MADSKTRPYTDRQTALNYVTVGTNRVQEQKAEMFSTVPIAVCIGQTSLPLTPYSKGVLISP